MNRNSGLEKMANEHLPHLSEHDPREISEGTIDPLGLYSIADALGTKLAPGIRERGELIFITTPVP